MFPFLQRKPVEAKAGLIAVVGSSTITVSIIVSKAKDAVPTVVWSEQDSLAKTMPDKEHALKTLTKLLTLAGDKGLKTLWQSYPKMKISAADVSIATPFAYTTVKQISTNFKQPTRVSENMVNDITEKAEAEVKKMATETLAAKELKLAVVSSINTGLNLNGYRLRRFDSNEATTLELYQMIGLTEVSFLDSIKEAIHGVFPKVSIDVSTTMADFFTTIRQSVKHLDDVALISITGKTTEVCVIPEDIPTAVDSMDKGKDDLVEDLIDKIGMTEGIALGLISDAETTYNARLSVARQDTFTQVLSDYDNSLVELFKRLNSTFTVPKVVYLHVPPQNQNFFAERIKNAATLLGAKKIKIYPVTTGLIGGGKGQDMTTLLPAIAFHTQK